MAKKAAKRPVPQAPKARPGGGGKPGKRRPTPVPQPPAAAAPPQQGGYYQYQQPVADQLSQPYSDALMGGAMGALPSMFQNYGQQNQMGDIYGQSTAGTLGDYGQLRNPNLAIQQQLAAQIQAIQSGADKGYDPLLDQTLGDQQRIMEETMRRQLGGDWENSSAGIEARNRFNQNANIQRGTSRFNQLQGLLSQQQAGMGNLANQGQGFGGMFGNQMAQLYNQGMGFGQAGQQAMGNQINRTGAMMDLYSQVPTTMAQFGNAMSNQAGAAVGAQGPYQRDRFGQMQASYAPTGGQYWGQMAGQSGDRWGNIAGGMMGMGGGAGPQTNQWGGTAGTGQGDPAWNYNANAAGM